MKFLLKNIFILLLSLFVALFSGIACRSMAGQGRAYIKVSNQSLNSNLLIIDEVYSPGPGWIIIHKEQNGRSGPMLGFCKVTAGLNKQIRVQINPEQATITLYASLHTDAGIKDTLEFPGNDLPVKIKGQAVMSVFRIQ